MHARQEACELGFSRYAELFLREYGAKRWRSGTLSNAETNIRRWIIPVWRDTPLTKIGRSQIALIFDRLPANSLALPRNVFALLRKLFVWAVERGDLDQTAFLILP